MLSHVNNKRLLSRQDAEKFILEKLPIPERKRREREQKGIFPKLNQDLFDFRAGKFELDPMRLLQIGDAAWNDQDKLPTAQVLVSVNRKKELKRDKHGNEILGQAEKNENLCKLLESVPAWRYRAFSGQLNLQNMNGVKSRDKQPSPHLIFTIEQIAKYCSKHYLPILKSELKILRERGFLDSAWDKNIQTLLDKITGKLLSGQIFLLRVGRHSGAESVTIDGVRHIKIMKGNPEYQPQTKTLWLAANEPKQRTNLLPFGWLLVEVEPGDASTSDWPELKELCANQNLEARLWAEQHDQQQAKLLEKRHEAEQRREREDIERHHQAELAVQAEQERLQKEQDDQLRLASMTHEQQQIEALQLHLQQKQATNVREQIGGPLYSAMRELINQTSAWTVEDKTALLAVAKQILELIGAGSNKKAKELLKNLQ